MNGKIEFVTLSMRDHGCLTYGLGLKFAGGGCVYGIPRICMILFRPTQNCFGNKK